jgi:hypothetical protein
MVILYYNLKTDLMNIMDRIEKVSNFQEEMTDQIVGELDDHFISTRILWSKDHVLEVYVGAEDYDSAMELMRMECPTEASSLFGMPDHESGYLLVFQFDNI